MHHVADRHLGDLPADRARDVGYPNDHLGHMIGTRIFANEFADAIPQCVVERDTFAQPDEQDDAHVPIVAVDHVLADDQAFDDLRQLLDLSIDLGRPDAHATGIECGVAPAGDDHAAMVRDLGPVSVTPDARIVLEVGGPVLRAIGIIPEGDGHAGKRLPAYELTRLTAHRHSGLVEHVDVHT